MQDASKIEGVLRDLCSLVPGIHGIVVADEDGGTLCQLFRRGRNLAVDPEGLAALAAATHSACRGQGRDLGLGELHVVFCEYARGNLVTASRGRSVVCVATDAAVPMARIGSIVEVLVEAVAGGPEAGPSAQAGGRAPVEEGLRQALREIERL